MHYYKASSETFQHFTSPGSPCEMLTFVVCVCHSRPLFEGLKWTSTFLIVSSCSHCTLIWAARDKLQTEGKSLPVDLTWTTDTQTQTHTTDECGYACVQGSTKTHIHEYTLTILIPVGELMRTSFSYHSLLVTWWSSTVLSLLTFKNLTESSQKPPACWRQQGGLMVTATTL